MMNQRKLTDNERLVVGSALHFLYQAAIWSGGTGDCWRDALRQLNEMLNHGTTDGCQFVNPEPPIPDGYRLAVAGDEGRTDCLYWSDGKKDWAPRAVYGAGFCSQDKYIVPADRIPTDTEAQSLPVVMVRDYDDRPWEKSRLIRVTDGSYTCLAASRRNFETWSKCRHLYPNESF